VRAFAGAATCFLFSACDSSPPSPVKSSSASRPVTVEIVNLSPGSWRIDLSGATLDAPPRRLEIPSRATRSFTLPADTYTITQTALGSLPPAAASRQFTATFAPGESYRWPLATLLTGPAEPAP